MSICIGCHLYRVKNWLKINRIMSQDIYASKIWLFYTIRQKYKYRKCNFKGCLHVVKSLKLKCVSALYYWNNETALFKLFVDLKNIKIISLHDFSSESVRKSCLTKKNFSVFDKRGKWLCNMHVMIDKPRYLLSNVVWNTKSCFIYRKTLFENPITCCWANPHILHW